MARYTRSRIVFGLILVGFLCDSAAGVTVYFTENFEGTDAKAWTIGSQSLAQAQSGTRSLQSLQNGAWHTATVTRGEGFFHVAGDPALTRISFSVYSALGTSWSINFVNQSLSVNMQAFGSLTPGQWNQVNLTPCCQIALREAPCGSWCRR